MPIKIKNYVLYICISLISVGCNPDTKELESALHVNDDSLFYRIANSMEEQGLRFQVREQESATKYIFFEVSDVFKVRQLTHMLQGRKDNAEYRGLCKSDIEDRKLILNGFVENKINHMLGSSDLGYCVYWSSIDTLEVLEHIEVYKEIVDSKLGQA